MQLQPLDWIIAILCVLVCFVPGLFFGRRAGKNTSEFFASGRSVPWWLAGLSMVATTFSTDTPNLVTNFVREHGVANNWQWWAFLLTGTLTVFVYARLWRRSGILTDLLDLLLGEVKEPLRLSRLEGDAVISYAPELDRASPQILVDRLENTYVAFRRALEQIVVNTTCQCQACVNIGALDLKFVVHHGPFAVQHVAGHAELVGPEVNFLFRLVKNRVREDLGIPGYLAFSDAAVAALGLAEYVSRLVEHHEDDPERGRVRLRLRDMGPVWEGRRSEGVVDLAPGDILLTLERRVPVPLTVAWDYLTRPDTRATMFGSDKDEVERLPDGRMGKEAVYVCWHGETQLRHAVIDWDPPHRYAFTAPVSGGLTMVGEFRLEGDGDETLVSVRATKPKGNALSGVMRPFLRRGLTQFFTGAFDRLVARVEEDMTKAG